MVEIEQSAETRPPPNVGDQAHRRWRSLQELVVESLMVSLAMVVFDVLARTETGLDERRWRPREEQEHPSGGGDRGGRG